MSKTLFIVRHAHRDKDRGAGFDNGLSEKGQKQAKKLKKYFVERFGKEIELEILSSPKKRCIETVAPIAEEYAVKIEESSLLVEGEPIEAKVQEFYKWWASKAGPYTLVSSHGDWIPYAIYSLTGARVENRKGSFAEISGPSSTPYLVTLIQEF